MGVYKSIGNVMNINMISIIALFAIQECAQCNTLYPKSWTIVQPDIMRKLVNNFKPKCNALSILDTESKYELRYCKSCNIEQVRDSLFNAIYNSPICSIVFDEFEEMMKIIDVVTLYSIGSILSCSNFDNCNNEIIVDNHFDGFIQRKDVEGNIITKSDSLDKVFCFECTLNENRCDRIRERCSFCSKTTEFGHNKTCNGCFRRFCDECIENEDIDECYMEKKYYFNIDGKMKYYQYCGECTIFINDDLDILEDDISSISCDPYQALINDVDYTEYKTIDDHYYYICCTPPIFIE